METQNTNETNVETTVTKSSYFQIEERGSSVKTELLAGLVIFIAMFYIIPVQGGMLGGFLEGDALVNIATIGIVTAMTAGITSIIMGLYANHPASLASGMGVNAFIAYTLMAGPDGMSFEAAMSAVLVSGLIFLIVSITPARRKILGAIPDDLKMAITIGVGFFLFFVALVNGGIIGWGDPFSTATFLGDLSDPFVILSFVSIFSIVILWLLEVEGSILIGMGITIVIGLIMNWVGMSPNVETEFLPSLSFDLSVYADSFKNLGSVMFQPFVGLADVKQTWINPEWYLAIFVLFLNDFFDTAGTLFGLNHSMEEAGYTPDEKTNNRVMGVDSVGTIIGSFAGATNVTTFAETGSGVAYGGRTGLTSITAGSLFLISIPIIPFLTPLFTSSVTTGAVVMIGIMMAAMLKRINVEDKAYLVSSIFTILFMILTYSIGTGIVIGLLTFIILMICTGRAKELDWVLLASSPMFIAFLALPLLI